jgi:hypothetical protein
MIKLPSESGLLLGPQSIDLLEIITRVKAASDFSARTTLHIVPSLDGSVKTLDEAVTALKDGSMTVNAFGGRTLIIYANDGQPTFYLWDVESEELHKLGRPVGNNLIEYHGANYTTFDNNGDIFNFNKSWFLSVGCLTMHATGAFQGLFTAGDNSFNWLAGNGNYGIYLDDREPVTQGGSSRQNTWSDPAMSRVMLNYDHTTKKLEYWLGAMGSNPTLKILDIEQYQGDPVNLYETPTELCLGKGLSGSNNLRGELNELIGGTQYLGSSQVQAIYSGDGKDWSAFPQITIHAPLGEDTYPSVSVTGNVLSNGQMVGGSADDYKPIPEE